MIILEPSYNPIHLLLILWPAISHTVQTGSKKISLNRVIHRHQSGKIYDAPAILFVDISNW